MLSVVSKSQIQSIEDGLLNLRSKLLAVRKGKSVGEFRYSANLREQIICWVQQNALKPSKAAVMLGLSPITLDRWISASGKGFRAISVESNEQAQSAPLDGYEAKIIFGTKVHISVPVNCLNASFLATLLQLS